MNKLDKVKEELTTVNLYITFNLHLLYHRNPKTHSPHRSPTRSTLQVKNGGMKEIPQR